jgi:hypothetical protein
MRIVARTRSLLEQFLNAVLNPLGYQIRPLIDESDRAFLSPKFVERQNSMIADVFGHAIQGTQLAKAGEPAHILELIRQFRALFMSVPFGITPGGSGFNSCLNLYLVAKLLQPSVMLESGSFKGMSSWVLRNAAPQADLHCFDLTFSRLKYRHHSIHYHERDMTAEPFRFAASDKVLAFFDDHVNQAQRITDSRNKNVNFIVFDDSHPAETLYVDKMPATPTVPMVMDDSINNNEIIEWKAYRRTYRYQHDVYEIEGARREIAVCRRLPLLVEQTGYRPSYMHYVELGTKSS